MKKLSKREKVMIYIMVLVVIIGLGFILFRTQYKKYSKANDEYDSLAMQQQLQIVDLSDVDMLKKQAEEAETYYNSNQNLIKQYEPPEMVEQEVLALVKECHLNATATTISENVDEFGEDSTQEVEGENQQSSEGSAGDSSEESTTEESSEEGVSLSDGTTEVNVDGTTEETGSQSAAGYIYTTVTLTLNGTVKQFADFMESCKGTTNLQISAYNCYSEEEKPDFSLQSDSKYTFYVDVRFYMKK